MQQDGNGKCRTCGGTGNGSAIRCGGTYGDKIWDPNGVVYNYTCPGCKKEKGACQKMYSTCNKCGNKWTSLPICGWDCVSTQNPPSSCTTVTGYNKCSSCSGTGRCRTCSGSGKVNSTKYCSSHSLSKAHWYCGCGNDQAANYHQ